jgi:hypothetical protein
LAIFTNAGLLVFTLRVFDGWEIFHGNNLFPFLLIVFCAWILRRIVRLIVSNQPEEYKDIENRHKYIVDKCIKGFAPVKRSYKKSRKDFKLKVE